MEDQTQLSLDQTQVMIKILLLQNNDYVISQISEVLAELGDPNCKLTKPYRIVGEELEPWMGDYTRQTELMIQSDKIVTLVDPNEKFFDMYSELIK